MESRSLHEINKYSDTAFPVGMYTVTREKIEPKGRGYLDLHWHEELQFTLVTEGELQIQVNGQLYVLKKGEAIFINRNLLHITTNLTADGQYVSFNFPDKMLGFFSGSRMLQEDVLPYTNNYAFPATVFSEDGDWNSKILEMLTQMRDLYLNQENSKRAYGISTKIVEIWCTLIEHVGEEMATPSKGYVRKQERMQQMLTFIHTHFMEPIHLTDIAAAANVSVGECSRCFREMVRESPNQYLLGFRISRGMEMLHETEKSVTEIGFLCGFSDASHFIQYFKKKTGITPKEYRTGKC